MNIVISGVPMISYVVLLELYYYAEITEIRITGKRTDYK